MNKEELLLEIEKEIEQNTKNEKKYCNNMNIYFILFVIFCVISILSFLFLIANLNIFFMISLIAGVLATLGWMYDAAKCSSKAEECRKNDLALNTAIWIVKNWVKDGKLESNFFKQVQVEFHDKNDRAISFLKTKFNIKIMEE